MKKKFNHTDKQKNVNMYELYKFMPYIMPYPLDKDDKKYGQEFC